MDDVGKASAVVADMRKIIRQDPRIIQKLHRRVFFDKLTREQVRKAQTYSRQTLESTTAACNHHLYGIPLQVTIYVSFYVEAANRDAFMSIKQDLLLAFIDCVDRNGAKLAKQRLEVSFC